MTCKDLSEFQPLRMTVFGVAGTGKTTLIKTLMSVICRMFNVNEVTEAIGPTYKSAAEIYGQTCSQFAGMSLQTAFETGLKQWESQHQNAKDAFEKKIQCLLCLFFDDKELIPLHYAGMLNDMFNKTATNSVHPLYTFGKIPIVVMFGNDTHGIGLRCENVWYSVIENPIHQIPAKENLKKYMHIFPDCAQTTMSLTIPKRNRSSQDHKIIHQLHMGSLNNNNNEKLENLNISSIATKFGDEFVKDLKKRATFVTALSQDVEHYNIKRLLEHATIENPVAVCNYFSDGPINKQHFKHNHCGVLLSRGVPVQLSHYKGRAKWGIHNEACGTVVDIVFKNNDNPNDGKLPEYVSVYFPNYKGPEWKTNNPKVRTSTK